MQEYFEKIKERLERERDIHIRAYDVAIQTHERAGYASYARACDEAIEIEQVRFGQPFKEIWHSENDDIVKDYEIKYPLKRKEQT